jgi:hypothetical protein
MGLYIRFRPYETAFGAVEAAQMHEGEVWNLTSTSHLNIQEPQRAHHCEFSTP